MPSPIAHCSLAILAWPPLRDASRRPLTAWQRWALLGLVLFALVAPDLDILLDPLLGRPAFTMHGGPTHSLAAGVVFAAGFAAVGRLIAPIGVGRLYLVGLAAYWSHVLLDAATWGGGVALLWPLTGERFSFPVPLFYGVRHSQPLALHLHAITVVSEAAFTAALWLVVRTARRRRAAAATGRHGAPGPRLGELSP